MDPDMVRQQAEAEREALALLQAKPAGAAPARAEPVSRTMAAAVQDIGHVPLQATALRQAPAAFEPSPYANAPRREAAAAPAAARIAGQAPGLRAQLQPARKKSSVAGHFGRFISYGLAGAMLGGGLGIVAVNYFQLPADLAQLAIFGPAGFFSAVCAIASFFTKTPEAYH